MINYASILKGDTYHTIIPIIQQILNMNVATDTIIYIIKTLFLNFVIGTSLQLSQLF